MKKVTLLVVAALLAAVPAFGANVLSETFPYPDDTLTVASGGLWSAHSGANNNPVFCVGGKAVYGAGSEDVNRVFSATIPNTTNAYACFELTVVSSTPYVASGYFIHFRPGGGSFNYRSRLRMEPPAGGGDFALNINNSVNALGVAWPQDLLFNRTYVITLKYDPTAGTSTLWVDAATEASPSVTHADAASAQATGEIALRQSGGAPSAGTTIDNIEVGTSFSDVCPQPTPVEKTSFGRIKALYR